MVTIISVNHVFIHFKGTDYPIDLKIKSVPAIREMENNQIYVVAGKFKFPLKIRRWWSGDRFQPFGMSGKKKLSEFFRIKTSP